MELYIGGFAQGKTEYVREKYREKKMTVWKTLPEDAEKFTADPALTDMVVVEDFHLMIRRKLEMRVDMDAWFQGMVGRIKELEQQGIKVVVISDEVGNGIVPMDPFEREWRECVGRRLTGLAKEAECVERVICGMGQRIK